MLIDKTMSTMEPIERRWVQVNVELCRSDNQALQSARAVFSRLEPLVARWRANGLIDCFYFMRKPPDLRLRFCGRDPDRLLAELASALIELRSASAIERFFRSAYEPEERLFGGPEAMAAIHEHFDADTTAWMLLDQLRQEGRAVLAPELLACAVINDLCTRLLDADETWDVWCNITTLVGSAQPIPSVGSGIPLLATLGTCLGIEERRVSDLYRLANQRLSDALTSVWNAGQLKCGLRGVLTYLALFFFHRHGLGGEMQAAAAAAMSRAWNPHRSLRGGEAGPSTNST